MAIFHLQRRKRIHLLHLEDFPSKKKWIKNLDKIIYLAGLAAPLLIIPQVLEVWVGKKTAGVSVSTWMGFTIVAIIWLIYASVHKSKPLIIMYIGLIIMYALVFTGVFIYG